MTTAPPALLNLLQRLRLWNRARRYLRKNEPDECRFTCDCLRPGQIVLDIGAHKAAFTYWMSRAVGRGGHVYAFEPQPNMAAYLERFANSCRHRNITVCPVALSERRGRGQLMIPATQWAHLQAADEALDDTAVEVPVETLDAYLEAIGAARPISFVKCDVELHELEVFRGGRRLLAEDRPVLLFESLPLTHLPGGHSDTFAFLEQLGYRGYFFYESQLVPLSDYSAARHTLVLPHVQNYVFLHPQAARLTHHRPPYLLGWTSAAGNRFAARDPRRQAA